MIKNKYWNEKSINPLQDAVRIFIQDKEIMSRLPIKEKKKYEEKLLSFLETIKEPLAEEVQNEKFRAKIALEMECMYDDFGKEVYKILPKEVLDGIILECRQEIAKLSNSRDRNDEILQSVIRLQNWGSRSYRYSETEKKLYVLYLKEWYSEYVGSPPSSIEEFLSKEMSNRYIAPKYWNALKEQENPRRLSKEDKGRILNIVNRAESLGLISLEESLAIALLEMATVHYDIDLELMQQSSDFDFLYNFAQLPQHFNDTTGDFDDRFVPKFSKRSLQ